MDHSVKAYNNNQRRRGMGECGRRAQGKENPQANNNVFHDLQKNHSWELIHLTPNINRINMGMNSKIHVVKYWHECIHKPERHYFGKHSTPLLLVQSYIIILSSNNSQCSIYQGKNPTKAQVLPASHTAVQLQLTLGKQNRVVFFLQLINIFLSHKTPVYMYHPTLPAPTCWVFYAHLDISKNKTSLLPDWEEC